MIFFYKIPIVSVEPIDSVLGLFPESVYGRNKIIYTLTKKEFLFVFGYFQRQYYMIHKNIISEKNHIKFLSTFPNVPRFKLKDLT